MKRNKIAVSANIVLIALLLLSCGQRGKTMHALQGDTIRLSYAQNLSIIKYSDYTIVNLRNPWDTLKNLHTYILTNGMQSEQPHLPE